MPIVRCHPDGPYPARCREFNPLELMPLIVTSDPMAVCLRDPDLPSPWHVQQPGGEVDRHDSNHADTCVDLIDQNPPVIT